MKVLIFLAYFTALLLGVLACRQHQPLAYQTQLPDTIYSNIDAVGAELEIVFKKGNKHNYPTFAFWIEDTEGNYIQTLFVTHYVATGIFGHGDAGNGEWKRTEGEARRPATLPYWLHKRANQIGYTNILPTPENPVPDAYTGATPKSDFILKAKTDQALDRKFKLLLEINQAWDWNDYWTTGKYPDEPAYNPSAQPSLIYAVTINPDKPEEEYFLNPIGHGHYSGSNGKLYTNLSTFTTAFDIVESVRLNSLKK